MMNLFYQLSSVFFNSLFAEPASSEAGGLLRLPWRRSHPLVDKAASHVIVAGGGTCRQQISWQTCRRTRLMARLVLINWATIFRGQKSYMSAIEEGIGDYA